MYTFNGFCKVITRYATLENREYTGCLVNFKTEEVSYKIKCAALLLGEFSRTLEATAIAEKFMEVIRRHTSFDELTPTLLREFVEKIIVHESEALDGKHRRKLCRQEIEIHYSFVGKVELPDA